MLRSVNAATPLVSVRFFVPFKTPAEPEITFNEATTDCPLEVFAKLPYESKARTTGCCAAAVPLRKLVDIAECNLISAGVPGPIRNRSEVAGMRVEAGSLAIAEAVTPALFRALALDNSVEDGERNLR